MISGPEEDLNKFKDVICKKYKTKIRAMLGPETRDDRAVIILGRVVEWRADGICMEADPWHVELILKERIWRVAKAALS